MSDPEAESKNAASPPPLENRPAETERGCGGNGCLLVVVALATLAMIFSDELDYLWFVFKMVVGFIWQIYEHGWL